MLKVETDLGTKARMPTIPPFGERHDEWDSYFRRFELYATVKIVIKSLLV